LISWPRELDMFLNLIKKFPQKKLIIIANDIKSNADERSKSNSVIIKLLKKENIKFHLFSEIYKKKKFKILISTGETCSQKISCYSILRFCYAHTFGTIIQLFKVSNFFLKLFGKPLTADGKNCKLGINWFPEKSIADITVKFPDGVDIKLNSYPYNFLKKIFDIFLTYSDLEARLIKKKFKNTSCMKIDYYRYQNLSKNKKIFFDFKNYKKLNYKKKTIYWMPTHIDNKFERDQNIILWSEKLAFLNKRYNLIVRPHPKTILTNQSIIKKLNKLNFIIDDVHNRKIGNVIKNSNLILCDYGGTLFSSIYLEKPIVLLNFLRNSQFLNDLRFSESLDLRTRKDLSYLELSDSKEKIEKLFKLALVSNYSKNIQKIKNKYFGKSKAYSVDELKKFLLTRLI